MVWLRFLHDIHISHILDDVMVSIVAYQVRGRGYNPRVGKNPAAFFILICECQITCNYLAHALKKSTIFSLYCVFYSIIHSAVHPREFLSKSKPIDLKFDGLASLTITKNIILLYFEYKKVERGAGLAVLKVT